MTKILLGTTALVAVMVAGAAQAADMPLKAPPQPACCAVYNWTGFYLGAHLGAGWARKEWSEQEAGHDSLGSHNAKGVLGGFQAGYNWQVTPSMVLGVEGQFSFADLKGDHQNNASATLAANGFINDIPVSVFEKAERHELFSTKVRDIATIAGRIGFVGGAQNMIMWYVKGGGAWARDDFADNFRSNFVGCAISPVTQVCAATDTAFNGSARQSRWGWMVGTGLEYALSGNWSAKIEYDYLDLGDKNVALTGPGATLTTGGPSPVISRFNGVRDVKVDETLHIIKIGVNYRFWGAGR